MDDPALRGTPEALGKRDVLEGRLIWLAMEALQLGTSVVLDFGFWGSDERSALRSLAASVGASCEVAYVRVDRETQLKRIRQRWERAPHETFAMTEADLDRWRAMFDEPTDAELAGDQVADRPAHWSTWSDWAQTGGLHLSKVHTEPQGLRAQICLLGVHAYDVATSLRALLASVKHHGIQRGTRVAVCCDLRG